MCAFKYPTFRYGCCQLAGLKKRGEDKRQAMLSARKSARGQGCISPPCARYGRLIFPPTGSPRGAKDDSQVHPDAEDLHMMSLSQDEEILNFHSSSSSSSSSVPFSFSSSSSSASSSVGKKGGNTHRSDTEDLGSFSSHGLILPLPSCLSCV